MIVLDDPANPFSLIFSIRKIPNDLLDLERLNRPGESVPSRKSRTIGRIRPLRHDAFQPHPADMLEHGSAVTRQMLAVPDGAPLGLADQSGEPPLALNQRQVGGVSV